MADGIVVMIRCNLYCESFLVCWYIQTDGRSAAVKRFSSFYVGYVADNFLILSDTICILFLITPHDTNTHLLFLSPGETKTIIPKH